MSPTNRNEPNHYEILGVNKESTTQDIKNAFLSKSKSHHPDLHPNDPTKHKTFVRIMEAYTILSKPSTRSTYDFDTFNRSSRQMRARAGATGSFRDFDVETNAPRYKAWRDETIWEMRDKETDRYYKEHSQSYYGIKGLKKMSNLMIAGGAIMFMVTGAMFQFAAIRRSSTFTVSHLDQRDLRLGTEWRQARNKAVENGNSRQMELLEAKLKLSQGETES